MTPTAATHAPKLWRFIGARVREARESTDMSMVEFALRVRLSRQFIYQLELGTRGARLEALYRIARATRRPVTFFLPPTELD